MVKNRHGFLLIFFLLTAVFNTRLSAQEEMIQPRRLINCHTAGILPRAHWEIETRVYPGRHEDVNGAGALFSLAVGITDRFMFGAGYGADGLVGHDGVKGNPWPGVLVKYRLIEESYHFPAIALGFDWQGYGGIEGYLNGEYNDETGYAGYVYKSQGFFLALSKNYLMFNTLNFGIHGAINYSLEEFEDVKWPNGYLGIDFSINEELAFSFEYDLALNHQDPDSRNYYNPLMGFFNIGLRWMFTDGLYIEMSAKDVFRNKLRESVEGESDRKLGWGRELKIVYISAF